MERQKQFAAPLLALKDLGGQVSACPRPHPLCPPAPDVNSRSARVLFLLVVPGHLVFLYTISCMQGGHTTLTLIFIVFYMTAALLQVGPGGTSGGQRGQGARRGLSDTLPPLCL